MDQFSYILINPSFLTKGNNTFALVSNQKSIGTSIKYFWNELSRKSFKIDDQDLINNFPMCIYDKGTGTLRSFTLDQVTNNDNIIKLKYNELLQDKLSDTLLNVSFDQYYNKLIDNFTINLDVSNMRNNIINEIDLMNNKCICFPQFRRKLLLRL
jgi:hypothetical protein